MKNLTLIIMTLIAQTLLGAPTLAPDKNLVAETLPNGMTIAAYRNTEPPNRLAMRLLVKRGSAFETDAESGLAHFIEHMAFNGTKHFPAGEMVEYFQRLGMAFGADTNAHTGFTETVYKLDMPEVSQKLIDDGLLLLRDYADSMLFLPDSIEKERGVILAEKDSRDSQDYRKAVKEIAHYFKGSIFAERMPIGEKSVIENAKQTDFQKFYRANYRPENTVLVIVGDIDVQKVLSSARKYFDDFKSAPQEADRKADFGKLETSSFALDFDAQTLPVDIVYDSTANSSKSYASISVAKELKNEPDSLEKRVQDYRITALSNAITARFLRIADTPDSKITQGSGSNFEFDGYCRVMIMNADAPVSKFADALEENFRQLLSLRNLSNAEIENSKKKIFESIESEIKGESTRTDRELANAITSSYSDGSVFTSPKSDMEIAEYALKDFDAKKAVELLKSLFSGARIKVFVSDTTAAIAQKELETIAASAFAKARNSQYPAEMFSTEKLIFTKFANAGKIAERKEIKDLSITQIRFANGVRANLKSTDFAKDEVLVKISFGDGILSVPLDKPEYFASTYALTAGGTKYQSASQINAAKFLLKMSLSTGIEGNNFTMLGGSTSKDFEPLIRYAVTLFCDAGFRDDGESSLKKFGESFYLDCQTSPMSQLRFLPFKMIASPVAQIPGELANFDKIKMSEIRDWLAPILKSSYMEISIVGDFDSEKAIELLSQTFGAMPERTANKKAPFADLTMKNAGENFALTYRTDDEPRSIAAVFWRSCSRENIAEMRAANVLGAVLDDVLRKDVRENQGKVYSPFAYNNSSTWIKNFGLMSAITAVVPSANKELIATLQKCGDKTIDGITEDDFKRAKIPMLKSVEANKRKNQYWLSAVLDMSQAIPSNIEMARTIDTGYQSVTLEEVRKLAKKIFSQKPYTASVMPNASK